MGFQKIRKSLKLNKRNSSYKLLSCSRIDAIICIIIIHVLVFLINDCCLCRLRPCVCDTLLSLRDYLAQRWSLDKSYLTFYNSQTLDSSLILHHHNSPAASHQAHTTHTSDKPVTDSLEVSNALENITASSATTEACKENISKESRSWRESVKSSQVELDSTYEEFLVEVSSLCVLPMAYLTSLLGNLKAHSALL